MDFHFLNWVTILHVLMPPFPRPDNKLTTRCIRNKNYNKTWHPHSCGSALHACYSRHASCLRLTGCSCNCMLRFNCTGINIIIKTFENITESFSWTIIRNIHWFLLLLMGVKTGRGAKPWHRTTIRLDVLQGRFEMLFAKPHQICESGRQFSLTENELQDSWKAK